MNRWSRISEAAVKQSGRSVLPAIDRPISFEEFVTGQKPGQVFLFHPSDSAVDLKTAVADLSTSEITLVVGPESGFSDRELALAAERGLATISLGQRILRTETAGMVIPALIIYLHELVKI
jgi:16S rRNA (uracil1498-N3)-methyltransferase